MSNNYKPGDVVNGHFLGDDNQWHPVQSGATAPAPVTTAAGTPSAPKGNWFARHKIITGVGGVVLAGAVISGLSGGSDTPQEAAPTSGTTSASTGTTAAPVSKSTPSATPKPVAPTKAPAPAKPKMTKTQENALRSAENYISLMGMSKKGLIRQLSSKAGDGYSVADATFAANNVKVDWKKEAVESAESYQAIMPMSRSGLIQQLTSSAGDGYTKAEATYAADAIGL